MRMGLEGKDSPYSKTTGIDTKAMVRDLQAHGIHVVSYSIIGLENQTPDNIDEVIEWSVDHRSDFHQFMLLIALPGTELYERCVAEGRLYSLEEVPMADWHGQYRFNHRHKSIPPGAETEYLTRAFRRDFAVNGPSMVRYVETELSGYQHCKDYPDARVRKVYSKKRWMLQFALSRDRLGGTILV